MEIDMENKTKKQKASILIWAVIQLVFFTWLFGLADVPVVGFALGAYIFYNMVTDKPHNTYDNDDDDDDDDYRPRRKRSVAGTVARKGGAFAIGYALGKKTGV